MHPTPPAASGLHPASLSAWPGPASSPALCIGARNRELGLRQRSVVEGSMRIGDAAACPRLMLHVGRGSWVGSLSAPPSPLLKMVASICCCSFALSTPVTSGVRSRNTCSRQQQEATTLQQTSQITADGFGLRHVCRTCCASSSRKSCFSASSVILMGCCCCVCCRLGRFDQ